MIVVNLRKDTTLVQSGEFIIIPQQRRLLFSCVCVSAWQNTIRETPFLAGPNIEMVLNTLPGVNNSVGTSILLFFLRPIAR